MKAPCGHEAPADGCRWCAMAVNKDRRYARLWWPGLELPASVAAPAPRPDRVTLPSCTHRGAHVEGFCCGATPVYECRLHERCTATKPMDGAKVCATCPDYQTPVTPAPTPARWEWVSTARLVGDAVRLAGLVPPDVTAVAGVPRSGMIPASVIAAHLHLPLYELSAGGPPRKLGHGSRGRSFGFPSGGRLLVVDDTVYGGAAMSAARRQVKVPAVFAAVYVRPEARRHADLYARALPSPHLLEWNVANNGPFVGMAVNKAAYRGGVGLDFDGVVCHDADSGGAVGTPYLVPRTRPCKLIATGRHERHRRQTLEWMALWGVRCERLEMLPDGVECTAENAAEHKARHYGASDLGLFVESCPVQAEIIHRLTGRPVACPLAGRVWQ